MTPRPSSRIFVCFAWLLIFAISPDSGYSADKWVSIRSRNFLLVGDASEEQIRRVGRYFEQFREAFAILFPNTEEGSSIGTTVVVFKNDSSFQPYKPVREGKTADVVGYFQHGEQVNYIALTSAVSNPSVILHEYVHSLMSDYAGGLPAWVNEGVAEYYGTFEMTNRDREFEIGRTISKHVSMVNGDSFIPLETLFTVDHGSPYYNEAEKQGVFYSQSWALIHYLMLGNKTRQPQLLKFLSLMTSEKLVVEMFSEAFQIDYTTLETELREYVRRRGSLPSMKLILRDNIAIDREMTATPLTEAQAEYYLGDLLYHSQRMAEAEAHLQKATMLDPNLGTAYATIGMVRLAQKQPAEAIALLKRAVAADPQNHIVHYYYARMLDQLDREDALPDEESASLHETMRAHLTKSIELSPAFLEPYKQLASLNLSSGEQLEGTETLLRNALSKASGRQDLALLLAQTMLRTNKASGARAILVPLTRGGDDPEVRKQAELVLKNLDLYSGDRDAIRESLARREIVEERKEEPPSQISRRVPAERTRREAAIEPINPITRVVDGEQISGLLVLLDCSSGLTLEVLADQQTVHLHTDAPGNIEFVSYISGVSNNVTCGRQDPAKPVRITYRKETREPTVVEFIEKN